ncbi:MAG: hypothetical protein SPE31_06880 [Prevotella sp.]|nr:hypothetical protein [Prevotella sp.]
MRHILHTFFILVALLAVPSARSIAADRYAKEMAMDMLRSFSRYIYNDCEDIDSLYACFRGENTMGSNEAGVRTNADLSMLSAFLCRYDRHEPRLALMAEKTLRYAVHTHKAVRRKACKDGRYWGSTSVADHQWESSLWAMSVAYSAFFQWERLDSLMRDDVYRLLKAECDYELERDIPTGYIGDTKAEENGWEVDVLAAALGLFPDDALAPRWFQRMREFAVNSYSHPSDADNHTIPDPWYDNSTISSMYRGANLYPDWTLQNHDFFHTSYQNVVIQELGEAALALRLFQGDRQKWKSETLLHNCDSVTQNVLNWLTLPDGEQAMPNGNDWSLFLYDQVTSYSTMACMRGDADALLFEQQALRKIARRQQTTPDGAWLLRPDVGARRMGVQGHRVMMTWLMHHIFPVGGMQPADVKDFMLRHAEARILPCQNIVRTMTSDYFACFSFSKGKRSFTGYIAPITTPEESNLVVPYRKYNTGNIVGYYTTEGARTNARLIGEPEMTLDGRFFSVKASLAENDSTIRRDFRIKTTPEGLEYTDRTRPIARNVSVKADRTGLMAISTDVFTHEKRDVETTPGKTVIDNTLTILSSPRAEAIWGDTSTENSITTTKIYPYGERKAWKHKVRYIVGKGRE